MFLDRYAPDILCLQETKCPDDRFPLKPFRAGAATSISCVNGQKGYHGVAILSRLPFLATSKRGFCGKGDARHAAVTIADGGGDIVIHNFYIPAGGDEPDPAINDEVRPQARLPRRDDDLADRRRDRPPGDPRRRPQRRAARERRLVAQAAAQVVSHTPVETERLEGVRAAGGWVDAMRHFVPAGGEALHLVELSRARLGGGRQGPPARPCLGDAASRRPPRRRPRWSATLAAGSARPTTSR